MNIGFCCKRFHLLQHQLYSPPVGGDEQLVVTVEKRPHEEAGQGAAHSQGSKSLYQWVSVGAPGIRGED